MKIGNLIAKEYQSLSDIEISEIKKMIELDENFVVTDIDVSDNPLFGTYFYFKVKVSKSTFKNKANDTLKFVLDKGNYVKGYFNVSKEVAGHLETDDERATGKVSDEIDWYGTQYTRTFHILDLKSRGYRRKHWTYASVNEIFEDDNLHTYCYDTDLNELQISEMIHKFSEIYLYDNN